MSTPNFSLFAAAIAVHITNMGSELFRVDISGDDMWEKYLASYPEGTNPIFRVRRYYDGSTDKNFIRQMGNVVTIKDGKLVSIWDVEGLEYPFNVVAKALSDEVCGLPINSLFRTKERTYGCVRSFEKKEGQDPIEWHHLNVTVPNKYVTPAPDTVCGSARTTVEMAHRAFKELTPLAVETTLDLIEQNTLYRGTEYREGLKSFKEMQDVYKSLRNAHIIRISNAQNNFIWEKYKENGLRIRNTAIGTLLVDLSDGMDLENALKRYESVVAPANYKRPTAAVTPKMIEQAVATIRALDLEPALDRRHATLADVSINNVLWADNKAQSHMKDGLTELLMTGAKPTPIVEATVWDITPEHFINEILPSALSIEVNLTNALENNLMSITAPVNADAKGLFKWDNNFAWSYNGNITDSIKARVKAAGGNTDAALRVSLAWFNGDDLDIHAYDPSGNHIYFGNKFSVLDVDMNAGGPANKVNPVENLSWRTPRDGPYRIDVNQYSRRSTENVGFTLEVENDGKITQYSYPNAVNGTINAFDFRVANGIITKFNILESKIIRQGISRSIWNLNTESFVRVETVLNSPNFWDNKQIGNKHWFFILEGCRNPEPCRGIYNEFLNAELNTHSKVFEVLGNKTKVPVTNEQLSGVGFSSTKRDSVTLRVKDQTSTRLYKVNF